MCQLDSFYQQNNSLCVKQTVLLVEYAMGSEKILILISDLASKANK